MQSHDRAPPQRDPANEIICGTARRRDDEELGRRRYGFYECLRMPEPGRSER
ncbi:MAG TPA: hypothetical protein VK886_21720 [Vicinamibacterales bacterium]|nr:hypothetical protein [Vicinamibacterales bacterium]